LNVFGVALPYVPADPPTFDGIHRCLNWPFVLVAAKIGSEKSNGDADFAASPFVVELSWFTC
jgi:hypothetical protein